MAEPSSSLDQLHPAPQVSQLLVPGDSSEGPFEAANPALIQLLAGLPLSHQVFRDPDFDPDQFLYSHRHNALEDLRTELRSYLSDLRSELVGLINEHYEDFIGLGMGLRGTVDRAMGKIKAPVQKAQDAAQSISQTLKLQRHEVETLLSERRRVVQGKKWVRLMLDCGDAVTRLEEMLSIPLALAPQAASTPHFNPLAFKRRSLSGRDSRSDSLSLTINEDPAGIESGTKRIERIAKEYIQMLYMVSKGSDLDYVTGLQPRIDKISASLHRELGSLFKSTLHTPRSDHRKREYLLECLRAYENLGAIPEAEEIIKNELVVPAMSKLIHRNSLDPGAMSPVLPASPEVARFNTEHQPHPTRSGSSSSSGHLLPLPLPQDPSQVPLPLLYNKILAFIARELALILDVADRQLSAFRQLSPAALPSQEGVPPSSNATPADPDISFNVLVNSIVSPTLQLIGSNLGSSLFASGNPAAFHRNFSCTACFLNRLESWCQSPSQLLNLRSHPDWQHFKSKWQLVVYAQIRTKEVILRLEEVLSQAIELSESILGGGANDSPDSGSKSPNYLMKATERLDSVLCFLWQEDVFLYDLTHRFWRLTLMAISRYNTWLESVTASYNLGEVPAGGSTGSSNLNSRSSSEANRLTFSGVGTNSNRQKPLPNNGHFDGADEASEEDRLRDVTVIVVDILQLKARTFQLFDDKVDCKLPKVAIGPKSHKPKDVLEVSLDKLTSRLPQLFNQIVFILVRRCSEKLRFIRSVGSSARAAKSVPTEPSYFIPDILTDLKTYLDRYGHYLPSTSSTLPSQLSSGGVGEVELKIELVNRVVDEIFNKYYHILLNVKKSEHSLKKLKRGRLGFSIFSTTSNSQLATQDESAAGGGGGGQGGLNSTVNPEESEEIRVQTQLRLDFEKLKSDSLSLGAQVETFKSIELLGQVIEQ